MSAPRGAVLTPNLENPDDFHARLVAAHEGLDEAGSNDLNARLVFLLANQIGSADVLADCIRLAVEAGIHDVPAGPERPDKAPSTPAATR